MNAGDPQLSEVSHICLVRLAATVWFAGVVILLFKSIGMIVDALSLGATPVLAFSAIIAGIVAGTAKARWIFIRTCQKNIKRIFTLTSPKIWQFYRARFFCFLLLMILFGHFAHDLSENSVWRLLLLASLELSISTALLISSGCFRKLPT